MPVVAVDGIYCRIQHGSEKPVVATAKYVGTIVGTIALVKDVVVCPTTLYSYVHLHSQGPRGLMNWFYAA